MRDGTFCLFLEVAKVNIGSEPVRIDKCLVWLVFIKNSYVRICVYRSAVGAREFFGGDAVGLFKTISLS